MAAARAGRVGPTLHWSTDRAAGAPGFGGALNLNVHIHALVLDGVFVREGGPLRFHASPELDSADVADVLAAIAPGVQRLLAGDGDDSAA